MSPAAAWNLERRPFVRSVLVGLCSCALLAPALASAADPAKERAREAYDRGAFAYQRGDFAKAAAEYARADTLAPNAVSLQSALDAAVAADDPVLGETLLARLENRPNDEHTFAALAATARDRFAHRTARVRFRCPAGTSCIASIDGAGVDVSADAFVLPGSHQINTQMGVRIDERLYQIKPDEVLTVGPSEAAPSTSPATTAPLAMTSGAPSHGGPEEEGSSRGGLAPLWFFAGAGVTGALGVATGISAADTLSKHNQYEAQGCRTSNDASCQSLRSDGSSSQVRTNVLVGVTGTATVATSLLGLVFVRWRASAATASLTFAPGPSASLTVTF
jgi:hypothetical protein